MQCTHNAKQKIRNNLRKNIKNNILPTLEQTSSVLQSIASSLVWKQAQYVVVFFPLLHEVNIMPLIQNALYTNKKVFFPLPDSIPLCMGQLDKAQIDIQRRYCFQKGGGVCNVITPRVCTRSIIKWKKIYYRHSGVIMIPGLAFTKKGERLGQGGGFYDSLFYALQGMSLTSVSVCYNFQLLHTLPQESHDCNIDMVYVV